MTLWAGVVLLLALIGTVINLTMGTPVKRVLHDVLLFLLAIGILVRIRYKAKEGEKEALKKKLEESSAQ
jgi:hypothetical protein